MRIAVQRKHLATMWAMVACGVGFGLLGVVHLVLYASARALVPPYELVAWGVVWFIPSALKVHSHNVTVDDARVSVVDGDGARSCARSAVAAMAIRSMLELAPRGRDPWRLQLLDADGVKLLDIRSAQVFGEGEVRRLAGFLAVPVEVQEPLWGG